MTASPEKPKLLSPTEVLQKMQSRTHAAQESYWACYSSWLGGIVTEPGLMCLPLDDHLVHRGDGVFEALKYTHGRIYLFENHIQRLRKSAERIGLSVPWSNEEIKQILYSSLDQGLAARPQAKEAMLRVFVSRGPGHFSTNPYDSVGSQLYVIVTKLNQPAEEKYQKGVSLGRSQVIPKPTDWAPYKTCNYLPNVMMKKESVDRGLDFVVGFDIHGFMTEASTENIVIVSQRKELLKPKKNFILQGTTMNRSFELARTHILGSLLDRIQEEDISEEMIRTAKEIMVVGTTWDILPVTKYEAQPVGTGEVGPVSKKLRELLLADQAESK